MKKNTLIIISLFLALHASAQLAIQSIQNNETELLINDSIKLRKGDLLKIHLPAGTDFMFVKTKKSIFSTKVIGNLSDIGATGALAIGTGSRNLKVIEGASKVISTANVIHRESDAMVKIQELGISKKAKKIAGKRMQVIDWEFTENGYTVITALEGKKYEIYLQEAAISGEIKLQ